MADISKIKILDGTTYNLRDTVSGYIDATSNQTIGGTKTFSDITKVLYSTSNSNNISPNVMGLSNPPWVADLWHDHFAFMRYHSVYSQETSADGIAWTSASKALNYLFAQRDINKIVLLDVNESAYRFVLKNNSFAYSGVNWFELAVAYTNPFSHFKVTIEFCTDATILEPNWVLCHESTVADNSKPFFFKNNFSFVSDGYLRFTFTKVTNIDTGSVNASSLKAFCTRKADQGLGGEIQYPYEWDANANIYPLANNAKNLGTSTRYWAHIYGTNIHGSLDGNASSASKLNTNAGSATQPIYFENGVPKATSYTLNKSVPSDAKFTDTTYQSLPAAVDGTDVSLVTTGEKYLWNSAASGGVSSVNGRTGAVVVVPALGSSRPTGIYTGETWYKIV